MPRQVAIAAAVLLATIAVAVIYTAGLRRRAVQPQAVVLQKPVTAPVSGPTERVTLYVADDQIGSVRSIYVSIPLPTEPTERAREILRALLARYTDPESPHLMAPGADINNVFLVNGTLAVIDVNGAFANEHRSGILVEELTVVSLVQTLAANIPGVNRVKLLVDGRERETLAGHADLADFYDVGSVGRLVAQMQPTTPQ